MPDGRVARRSHRRTAPAARRWRWRWRTAPRCGAPRRKAWLAVTWSSAYTQLHRTPCRKPPQIPARRVHPVPAPIEPEAPPGLILHPPVVARGQCLGVAVPPFAPDTLWPVGTTDAKPPTPPSEGGRRMIGQQRQRLDRLRRTEQPHRARQAAGPSPAAGRRQGRAVPYRAFRHIALYRHGASALSRRRAERRTRSGVECCMHR